MASIPTRTELLELDIELRLHVVLAHAFDLEVADETSIALLRMAYGTGYIDALRETRRGQLCCDHGFAVPAPWSEDHTK